MKTNRREFLIQGAGGVTLAATCHSLPSVIARTAAAASRVESNGRILVILQLEGGNDGLNTVVPFRDEKYRLLRPTLGVPRGQVLQLDDDVGLAPQLRGLKQMFDEGLLSVIQGVGYPNPNRSHFESTDIWQTADPRLGSTETGWLGRVIEQDSSIAAMHLADAPLPLALWAESVDVPSLRGISKLRLKIGQSDAARRAIEDVLAAEPTAGNGDRFDDLQFIHRTAAAACKNARRLEKITDRGRVGYPSFGLARRLSEIAQLIAAEFGPSIYYTSLGGFDTHARQGSLHPNLMTELSQSIKAFYDDLTEKRLADRVLLMTFSEFGRRAAENASRGTDHGVAAPLFVAGPSVSAGILGPRPDLEALVDGDIPYAIDFRRVYATVLQDWLNIAPTPILHGRFETLPLIDRK